MQTISSYTELKLAIQRAEEQKAGDWLALRDEYQAVTEKLNFFSILKTVLKSATAGQDLKSGLINSAIGLTSGIIAKKAILGKTHNPFSRLLGVILEVFVAKKVEKNAGEIRAIGNLLMENLLGKDKKPEMQE